MTDNEIVKALDGADVFLRDRARSKPSPLNEYDIALLLDIAKTCDEAATIINRQKAEIQSMNEREIILICQLAEERDKAIKEFAKRLKKKATCFLGAVSVEDINSLVEEMTEETT